MLTTLGQMPTGTPPTGFFKAISFPVLLKLDQRTGDGRLIKSAGFSSRDLPLSIKAQFVQGMGGHVGSEIAGTLFEVTIDPENGTASGRGFLLNDEVGRKYARMVHLQALRGNSVDLADVKVEINFTEDWDLEIDFIQAKLAATTGVATPAFAEAYAEVDPLSDDELMASLTGDPMEELVASFGEFTFNMLGVDIPELTASMTETMVAFDDFHIPEAGEPQKIIVDADGRVFGHLALWDTCWGNDVNNCIIPPRPSDGYASYNKPGVLTDRGIVETGPIMLTGGHRTLKGTRKAPVDVYGGIENAWADVRVTNGVLGPWISGRVRPGVSDETAYAARASQISGHWLDGKLKAIVSVNVGAYEVPGSGLSTAPFAFSTDESGVTELVASFPRCMEATSKPEVDLSGLSPETIEKFKTMIAEGRSPIFGADGGEFVGQIIGWALPPTTPTILAAGANAAYSGTTVIVTTTFADDDGEDEANALLLAALLDDD